MSTINYITSKDQGIELAKRVAHWLNTREGIKLSYPVMVTIGRNAYFGARYTRISQPPPGARNQSVSETDAIYLVGRLAGTKDCGRWGYQQRKRFAYFCNREMFGVGFGITEQSIDLQNAKFHPFGVWFSLTPYSPDILTDDNGVPYPAKKIRIDSFMNR